MHNLNSLVKLNVLLFKIQVEKRKNRHLEDPVVCGSGNLKATFSCAKIIVIKKSNLHYTYNEVLAVLRRSV